MDRFFNSIGQVPVAIGQVFASAANQVILVGICATLALGLGIAAAYGLQALANKANRNQQTHHFGTPAE